jgi:hypothetical protein
MLITLNGKSVEVGDRVSYEQIAKLTDHNPARVITITYMIRNGRSGHLYRDESIAVEPDMYIDACITGNA